jgi:hypothetical protein
MVDDFIANWETNIALARWDSVEDWAATIRQHFVRTERDPNAAHEPATERS